MGRCHKAQSILRVVVDAQDPKPLRCGLKGMESGMAECFGPIAEKNGLVWTEFAKAMKKADRDLGQLGHLFNLQISLWRRLRALRFAQSVT